MVMMVGDGSVFYPWVLCFAPVKLFYNFIISLIIAPDSQINK